MAVGSRRGGHDIDCLIVGHRTAAAYLIEHSPTAASRAIEAVEAVVYRVVLICPECPDSP